MPADARPPEDQAPEGQAPEDRPPEGERFRVLDARFWSAIVFLLACIVAAVVVAVWGPKIWPKAPPHPAPAASSAPAPSK